MISIFKESKESKEQRFKLEHEKQLINALAKKCADVGSQYASHQEDETEYTVVTINGEAMRVKKEEITIESPADLNLGNRKY